MTRSFEISCTRGDTDRLQTDHLTPHLTQAEHHQRFWLMGHREQAFLLVILPHSEPPSPRERTQEDFLAFYHSSLPKHAHLYSLGGVSYS